MPLANVEVAVVDVTLSAVVCTPAPKVEVALPKIVVVAVPPTYRRSKIDARVVDADVTLNRPVDDAKVNELAPPKLPALLNCTCVSDPPGVPAPPPVMPSDDVATRE